MFFIKKTLICPVVEQIGSSLLLRIETRIRINFATPLKLAYFISVTLMMYEGRRRGTFVLKHGLRLFWRLRLFCVTFWLYSAPTSVKTIFYALRIFLKILQGRWWTLKAFLFRNKKENFFMGDTVLFVIDFFAVFSCKQK